MHHTSSHDALKGSSSCGSDDQCASLLYILSSTKSKFTWSLSERKQPISCSVFLDDMAAVKEIGIVIGRRNGRVRVCKKERKTRH